MHRRGRRPRRALPFAVGALLLLTVATIPGAAAPSKGSEHSLVKPNKGTPCRTTASPHKPKPAGGTRRVTKPTKRPTGRPCRPPRGPQRAPQSTTAKLPGFVPDALAAELGVPEANGGKHGWARFGATLDAKSSFDGPKGSVRMQLVDAPAAKRIDFENGAAYVGASYTALQTFHGNTMKESIVVARRLGEHDWAWKFDLPKGKKAKLLASGAVDLGNGLYVPAPVVTRTDGSTIKTSAAWAVRADGLVTLRLDDRKFPLPYVVDPGLAPVVAFTGFSGQTGNTYIDPAFALTRIFINSAQTGRFTANTVVNDPESDAITHVCFPVYGTGWIQDGGCLTSSTPPTPGGILATYYSGSGAAGAGAFTTANYGTTPGGGGVCATQGSPVGPFSRIETTVDSFANWGVPGANDDTPYSELCDETYSAVFQGTIRTPTYTASSVWETTQAGQGNPYNRFFLSALSDDGVRIYINNTLVLADWSDHAPQWRTSCPITLASATNYTIKVEYYENAGNNRLQLRWRTPGSTSATLPPSSATANNASYCYNPNSNNMYTSSAASSATPWAPATFTTAPAAPGQYNILPTSDGSTAGLFLNGNRFAKTYEWTPGAAAPSPTTQNVVAKDDGAADPTVGTTPFTVIPDGSGPVGGSISVSAPAGGGLYNSTTGVTISYNATGTTDGAAGAVSGIASATPGQVLRQEATLSNGTCTGWPSSWVVGTGVTVHTASITTTSSATNSAVTGLASGKCYRWALTFTDNVGNIGAQVSPQTLMVDTAAPPAGAVTLTKGATNAGLMHVSGSRFYYNNSATGSTGDVTVTIAATDPESDVNRVQFPGMPGTWAATSTPVVNDTAAPWQRTYTWDDDSAQPAAGQTATIRDNALNTGPSAAWDVVRDVTGPTGGSVSYTNGLWGTPSHSFAFSYGTDGPVATGSGVATWRLERRSADLLPAGTCDVPTWTTWTALPAVDPASPYNDTTLVAGNCYQWRVVVTDNVGNTSTFQDLTRELRFDDTPPTASFTGITSVVGNAYREPGQPRIWYNPAGAGSFRVQLNATDAIGMASVTFPSAGVAGWTSPSPLLVSGAGPLYTSASSYSWTASPTNPPLLTALATDNAGNDANVTFDIDPDNTAPTGGTAQVPVPVQNTTPVTVTLAAATDTQSGLGTWVVQVQSATFTNNACGSYGSWTNVGSPAAGAPPATITYTAPGTGCYQTRLVSTDNVGNSTNGATSSNPARIDMGSPSVAVTGPADNSNQTGTFVISGTGAEGQTLLTNVSVTYAGPASGTACASATLTAGTPGNWTWSCSWTTPMTDGLYTLTVTGTDSAGNTGTTTWHYNIDNGPPVASFTSWTENSNYLYGAAGDQLWYNPSAPLEAGITATATVTATDAGSGMNRVVFPNLGAGAAWGAGGTDTTVGTGNTWTWGYTFSGGGAIGDPALTNAVAYDNAGASTGAPGLNFRIDPDSTAPTVGVMPTLSGLSTSTTLPLSVPLGTDSQSGVGRWVIDSQFAPLRDGVCGAWDPWVLGDARTGYFGTGVNGGTLTFNEHLNDLPAYDGIPDYHDSFCYRRQVRVIDNVGNTATIPAVGLIQLDFADPAVSIAGPAAGSSQSGTFAITGNADDLWSGSGIEYTDTGSGLQQVTVTYTGPSSGTACPTITTFTGTWDNRAWTCSWATGALADGTYTINVQARDAAGRLSTVATRSFLLDNQAPVVGWHSWNDNGNAWMHAVGNVAWVNPNAPTAAPGTYLLDARVTATDLGSGVAAVSFPALGTGWSPGTASNATFTSPTPVVNAYTRQFTFTNPSSLAAPGSRVATATDGAGNASTQAFEVRLDATAPTGMSAAVTAGLQSTPNVAVALSPGSEGATESGLGSWRLEYDTAPLANDTCGSWAGTWTAATTGAGSAPSSYSHDVSLLGSQCYRYRLLVTDNVGNVGTSTVTTTGRRVDLVAPTVAITSPATGSAASGTFNVSGTAGDAHSGINSVQLTWTGPLASSGTICNPATLGGSSPSWTFSCSWATGALPDGTYTVTARSFDRATNQSTVSSITLLLDNQPPFIGFHQFVETTPYTYWAGPVGTNNELWYNPSAPAGSYSFDVQVVSSDLGSGVARVEFEGAGTGWTPGGSVGTQTTPIGPADRYRQTYTFDTTNPGLVDPPTLHATAYDPANNPNPTTFELRADNTAPAAGTLSYTNGFVSSTAVTVNVATGGDGTGSGVASWALLRSAGTLSGATCTGWGGYVTSVATGTGAYTGTRSDTVTDPGCFRYRLTVTDNVGNVGTFDGTDQIKVDLVPPTGSLTITKGTNPAWQHLATPTRLYINTAAGRSGTFDVATTASAASGVLDAAYPNLGAGVVGDATFPGPGPAFNATYTWSALAPNPPTGRYVRVRSNSLGQVDLPFEVIADPLAPTGATVTHTAGYTTGTSVTVTYTSGSDGAGSGLFEYQLERESGTLAAGACTWTGTWTNAGAVNGALTYPDASLAQANCYRYRVRSTDNVGNTGYSTPSTPIMVDTTAPTGATITLAEATNPGRQYLQSGDTIWVAADPGGPASFTATVTATDPESGTGTATFPALGSTFVRTSTGSFSASYSWSATAVAPVSPSVLVANGSGLTTTIPFTVYVDGAAPAGATLDQQNGFDTDFSVDLSYAVGSDGAGSGVASWQVERRSAAYAVGTDTCSPWLAWGTYPLPLGHPASPYVDTSVTQPTCYQYRLVEVDNVGNAQTTLDGDTAKVIDDIFPPTAFDVNLPTNPALPAITTAVASPSCTTVPTFNGATPAFTWTASSDAQSGLAEYRVYVDGVGTVDGTVSAPGTSWTPPALADGAHTLGVRAVDNQSNFTNAGPAFPTNIRTDASAPTASIVSPAAASWTSDNTPLLDWTAADANCLARVEVYLDNMATPVAVTSGTEGDWTPSTPLADGSHTWRVEAIDVLGNRTVAGPVTFGVDTVAPTAFSVTAPTVGQTVRGFVAVSWTASSDADSGLAAATAYEVWVDGTLRTTVGSALTTATVSGLTNGAHTVYVRARDVVGNLTSTASVSFTGYGAIPAPTLVSPANNAFLNTVPALTWTWPSDGGPAPTSYDVFLDGVNVGSETHPVSTHAIADPGDGVHTWRISQNDPYTGVVTSVTRTFTLDRSAPLNPGPLTRSVTTVSWPAVTDPATPTATGIDHLEFRVDDGTTVTSTTLLGTATSRNYGVLPDGIYTMTVRAFDRAGNQTDSPPLVVTNDSVPPTPFALDAPAALGALPAITQGAGAPSCETAPTYVTATPTLSWQPSSDATSGLAGYDVVIDGSTVASVSASTTSYAVPSALGGGAHTWQVVARDNFGQTRTSTPAPMNVRVDGANPTISYSAPTNNSFTSDTTPTLSWTGADDNCAARVEVTVDGGVVAVLTGGASFWTPATALAEGSHTWSLRIFDSAGNVTTSGAARTFGIDTTAPTGVTAIFPANSATEPEQMMTFQWSAGSDAGGSGVSRYDITVDGTPRATGLSTTTHGTVAIHAGPHTWSIRAYDAVGNSAVFNFSFTASVVPDTTAPDPFNLLTPVDAATITAGTALTWEPAWDFQGIAQYRVYIDGQLAGTTAGNVTSFTPTVGAGSAICNVDFDPATSAGCLSGPTYSYGNRGTTTVNAAGTSTTWGSAAQAGWNSTGNAHGFGDASVLPITDPTAGYDGDRVWNSMEYTASIPAGGADLRFEHRYRMHMNGQTAFDGGTVELKVDTAGDGFGNDSWAPTCVYGTKAAYGVSIRCTYEVVEVDGGYNSVLGGSSVTAHPLYKQGAFSGSSGGMVQTKLRLSAFAGKNVQIRFRVGMDSCYSGMPTATANACTTAGAAGWGRAVWRIDEVTLANPDLLPGPHTWYVEARDAAGNARQSNQTWNFTLAP